MRSCRSCLCALGFLQFWLTTSAISAPHVSYAAAEPHAGRSSSGGQQQRRGALGITVATAVSYYNQQLRAEEPCQPLTVPAADRCAYVIEHRDVCYPDGGWQVFLRFHYCTFGNWQWFSLLLLAAAAALAFGILSTVSERFFCPALELISEYLKLPPVVAGATLLSFGNGAPDIFTQVAAVGQGGSDAVGMALAEPLGGSLFASNIVFGLVVLVAHRMGNVKMQSRAFVKDVAFLLLSVLLMASLLSDRKVDLIDAGTLLLLYVVYVCVTLYISRHDEPVHADIALHEVPQHEGVDIPDSCSSDGPPEPAFLDAATSLPPQGLQRISVRQRTGSASSSPRRSLASMAAAAAAAVAAVDAENAARQQCRRRPSSDLQEPLLPDEEKGGDDGSEAAGAAAAAARGSHVTNGVGDSAVAAAPEASKRRHSIGSQTCLPGPGGAKAQSPFAPAAADRDAHAAHGSPAAAGMAVPNGPALTPPSPAAARASPVDGRLLRSFKTFTEGMRLVIPSHVEASAASESSGSKGTTGRSVSAADCQPSPRRWSEAAPLSPALGSRPSSALSAALLPGTPGAEGVTCPAGSSPLLGPLMQQLQVHHQLEQQDLLQQQQEEHVALLLQHEEAVAAARSRTRMVVLRLQQPLVQVMSCTMPRVGTGPGHHYQRWRACLLPLTASLPLFLVQPDLLGLIGLPGLAFGGLCAAVGAAIIAGTYPSSNMPRKTLKGVFAVMTFIQATVWLNISAGALVQVAVLAGIIFGLQPSLLGATVLAWGNSVPDLINNLAMARDGFPSMAVAACFAAPLFTLLVGMGSALAYGSVLAHGVLVVPVDGPLVVELAFAAINLIKWLILVPLLYKFRLRRAMTVTALLYYACYNVVYGLTMSGWIHIPGTP